MTVHPLALIPVNQDIVTNTWMVAVVALTHILIATYITGSQTIAIVAESISIATGSERHERLAHGLVRSWAYVFGFGSALAILFVMFVLGAVWGRFFTALQAMTFWIFFFEALMFFGEIALLYTLYANWDRLRRWRIARLGVMILLNIIEWFQMLFINVVASFMITPNGGDTSYLRQILNPTQLPLTVHRTIGNVAWAGAAICIFAGVRAIGVRRRRQRTVRLERAPMPSVGAMAAGHLEAEDLREQVAFWDWAGAFGACFAFGFTLLQPFIGYEYAKEIQLHSYNSWYAMMLGNVSIVFEIQIGLLGLIFVFGAVYFARRLRAEGLRLWRRHLVAAVLLFLLFLWAVQPAFFTATYDDAVAQHIAKPWWDGGALNPLGNFIPWKILCLFLMVLIGLYSITSFLGALRRGEIHWGVVERGPQGMLLLLGISVMLMMLTMGVIREAARTPYLIGNTGQDGGMTISHQEIVSSPPPTGTHPTGP